MRKSLSSLMAVIAITVLSITLPSADAALIAGWDINGVGSFGPSPFAPSAIDANVTVGGLTRGDGVTTSGSAAGNAWGGNGWDGPTDADGAIAADNFATFSVKANPGYLLSLSSIEPYNIRRSGTGPTSGQWQYSLDAVLFTDIGSSINWGSTTTASGNLQPAIDLSSIAALQNLGDDTTVTFRVANWEASASGGTWYLNAFTGAGNYDFQVHGTANIVPEPGSLALLGMSSVGLLFRRNRR